MLQSEFPDIDGLFTLAAHAPDDEKAMFDFNGVTNDLGKPRPVYARQLASLTLNHPNFRNGDDILILGCSAGASGFAQSYVRHLRKLGIRSNVYAAMEGVFWVRRTETYKDHVDVFQKFMAKVDNNRKAVYKKFGD